MATTTNFGWTTPDDTSLVKDGAAAIRTLGQSIDTSMMDLEGGTTGQVLSKASNSDMDFTWVTTDDANAIQNAIVDAKGDLIAATAADTPARLAVGTNGHVLTADSAQATGIKWAAPAAGGKVLQVVQATYSTSTTSTSTTYADTGLTLSITPTVNTSKILVMVSLPAESGSTGQDAGGATRLMRDSTAVFTPTGSNFTESFYAFTGGSGSYGALMQTYSYLDSPATTSATTYKVQFKTFNTGNSRYLRICGQSAQASIIAMEIGA
jgi:hypothetical protein